MAKLYNVADFKGNGGTRVKNRRVEVYLGEDGQWYWRCIASNGRYIATGHEGFMSAATASASAVNALKGPLVVVTYDEHGEVQSEKPVPA